MDQYYSWRGECPHCKTEQEVEFEIYAPEDGEREIERIECECGCIFEIVAICSVEVFIESRMGDILSRPNPNIDAEEYHSNDPNQLSIL